MYQLHSTDTGQKLNVRIENQHALAIIAIILALSRGEIMQQESNYSGRAAEQHVRGMLHALGYDSVRVLNRDGPINLIAWKGRADILCIQVRRSRSFSKPEAYQENIRTLIHLARTGNLPGDLQLWLRTRRDWTRYAISPYGAMPIPLRWPNVQ